MATFRKRGDLQWQAIIKRKGIGSTSKTFLTRKDAEAWARITESEMMRGVYIRRDEAEKTTLHKALERYRDEVTTRKKGADREETRIRRWLDHKLAARSLASIRGADLARFRDEWRKAGKAENTIRLELALLSHLFEVCRREWGFEGLQNPVRSIALPGPSKRRERRLEGDEEARLMSELRKGKNKYAVHVVEFAIATAMRQSEILGLCWENVDMTRKVANLSDTKNGSDRAVPLSSRALDVLKALPRPIQGGPIFLISQDGLIRAFSRACERAGIVDLRFHDLRHESTSRLFELGCFDSMEVAAITGHKTLGMLKRYTHLKAENLAKKLG
jgi:integrase